MGFVKFGLEAAGVLAVAAIAAAGMIFAVSYHQTSVKQVEATAAVAIAQTQVRTAPVGVKVDGPTLLIQGDSYWFCTDVTGDAGTPTWRVIPETNAALEVSLDGRRAKFRSLRLGQFQLFVTAGGPGGHSASCVWSFEVVPVASEAPQAAEPPPPQAMAQEAKPATLTEIVGRLVNEVKSTERVAECRVIGGSIRSLIGRIETGQVDQNADVVVEIENGAQAALEGRYDTWRAFFTQLAILVDDTKARNGWQTAAETLPLLRELAALLSRAQ